MERFLIGFILLGLATQYLKGQTTFNTYVCSPANVTEPLKCSSEQWVHISQEIYSPTSDRTTSCEPNFTSCSAVFYDTDLVANCNGPTRQGLEACREETSVGLAKRNMPCLQTATNITTNVQYSCIDKSSVLDLCGASSVIRSNFQTVNAYLASPSFPRATPTGTLCLCTIQGIKVKMTAIDVNVQAKLPWASNPTMNIDPYRSVFSVSSVSDGVLWQSSQCTENSDCSTQHILNSNLFMPVSEDSSTVSVTYSDFGLYGQNVWVEVIGQGSTLNVTCTSEHLPPNRIITTTTSTSSTAKTTTATTMVPTTEPATIPTTTATISKTTENIHTTVATTPKTVTTAPTNTASLTTTTPSVAVYPSTISSNWMTQQSSTSSPGVTTTKSKTAPSIDEDDLRGNKSKNDSTALIITLVCILLALVIIAIVVGVLVYRKRRKFTYNGKVGLKALFLSLYHQMTNREVEKTDYHDSPFDPIAMDDVNQPYDVGKPCYEVNKNKNGPGDQNEAKISLRSCAQQESENESNLNGMADKQHESPVNIYSEIDQSGDGIVEADIDRIQQLRNNKTNKTSFENSHIPSSVSGNITGPEQGNGRNYLHSSHDDHDPRNITTGKRSVNAAEANGHIGLDEQQALGSSKAIKNKLDAESKNHHKSKMDEPKGDKSMGDEPKKDGNLKHSKQLHDQKLDSPKEHKIIASLGLPAVRNSSESVPDISNTAVTSVGANDNLYSQVDKRTTKENFTNRNLSRLQNNEVADLEVDTEKTYSLAKPVQPEALEGQKTVTGKKKMSRSDLVSTILQSTLQDIKQMRTNDQQKDDLSAGRENESFDLSEC